MTEQEKMDRISELQVMLREHYLNPLPNQYNYIQHYIHKTEVLPMYNEISNLMDSMRDPSAPRLNIFQIK